ncbi:signal-regulatory protein beta-2 [Lithobates pipiens]
MAISSLFMTIFTQHLILSMIAEGKAIVIRQQEFMTAKAGQSVTINCSFVYDSPSYTARWTRGCNHSVLLSDQTCYNGRISHSDVDPRNITTDSGPLCCKRYSTMTIFNLTENDSGIYCCHIQTAHGQKGDGTGTILKVIPKLQPDQVCNTTTPQMYEDCHVVFVVMESFRIICLIILIVLLGLTLKKICESGPRTK